MSVVVAIVLLYCQGGPGTTLPSSTSGAASSSSDSETSGSDNDDDPLAKFDDGMDEELVGDDEDRLKLDLMTEAEREQEMYNRYGHVGSVWCE